MASAIGPASTIGRGASAVALGASPIGPGLAAVAGDRRAVRLIGGGNTAISGGGVNVAGGVANNVAGIGPAMAATAAMAVTALARAYNNWRGAYAGYHQGWANGYWHGYHNSPNWNWGSFALGAASGRHSLGPRIVALLLGIRVVRQPVLFHGDHGTTHRDRADRCGWGAAVRHGTGRLVRLLSAHRHPGPAPRTGRRRPGRGEVRRGSRRLQGRRLRQGPPEHRRGHQDASQRCDAPRVPGPGPVRTSEVRASRGPALCRALGRAGVGLDDAYWPLSPRRRLYPAASCPGAVCAGEPQIVRRSLRPGLSLPDPGQQRCGRRPVPGGSDARTGRHAVGTTAQATLPAGGDTGTCRGVQSRGSARPREARQHSPGGGPRSPMQRRRSISASRKTEPFPGRSPPGANLR